jgi:hypothetical protein
MRRPFLLAALIVLRAAGADAVAPSPVLGCWSDETGDSFMRFSADGACTILEQGQRTAARAKIAGDAIELAVQGQHVTVNWKLAGERLLLTAQGKETAYHRVEAVPEGMDPKPLALGSAAVAADRVATLQAEFRRREVEDQAVRTDPAKQARMGEVDAENTAWLKELVQEIGWIDCDRFGAEAANTAFLLVQHSGDLPLMLAALPPIEADVKAKKLDGQPYALLYDRLQLHLGGRQRYGSQIGGYGQGAGMVVLPLEDREHVDDRRRELGMGPLSQYLDYFKQQNGGKDIPFSED